ncbi:MAG: hypothetical protein GY751_05215 [Bacteroidetes bacterium]|nr:hypothetical protein [Bacteroidota bacterium]
MPHQKFGIDIRSLGLFRIFLGLSLLFDLLYFKLGLFNVLISPDQAIFPVSEMHRLFGFQAWSVFDVLGPGRMTSVFLLICGLTYLLLTLGYRSRIVSILAFICFWNLSQRIAVFYNPAEMLTGCMLFLGMFLPLDSALSIRPTPGSSSRTLFSSPFTVLILFQLALVYLMFAVVRLEPELLRGKLILNYFSDMLQVRPQAAQLQLGWMAGRIFLIINIVLCLLIPVGISISGKRPFGRWLAIISIAVLAIVKLSCTWSGNWMLISLATMSLLLPEQAWKNSHYFGTNHTTYFSKGHTYSRLMSAMAFVIGLFILHQNALTLTERPGVVAKLMKKTKLTRIIKLSELPRFEKSSLFNQDWVKGLSSEALLYGQFKAMTSTNSMTESRRFRNYCNSGLAVWRNEMYVTDVQSLLTNWLRYESKLGDGSVSIHYENSSQRILMAGQQDDWIVSEWTPPVYYYKFKGPVDKIKESYGAPGTHAYRTFQKEHHGYTLMVYAPVSEKPVPVLLFTHAFFGHNYQIYKSLMEHVASWGYAFAFVPYRKGKLNKDADDRRIRYADVWQGFEDVMTTLADVIDTNSVVVAGHSYGGGTAASLAVKLFTETKWGQDAGGIAYFCPGYMEGIDQDELSNLPGDLQLMAQVYEMDTVTDAGMAWDFYKHAGIADSNKLVLVVEPDTVDGYSYMANHYVPLQIGPNQYFDAYDYYAVFRPFHAFLKSVFEKDSTSWNYLYDRQQNKVLNMGPKLNPMKLMTSYSPLQPKDWYWAPCDHPGNPRREFCP